MPDKDLVHRAQHGDTHAFDRLVSRYHLNIHLLIQRHVLNPETVKDLCQETYLKSYLGIGDFRGDSAFYSWLYRIAHNVCVDYQRRQKRTDIESWHTADKRCIVRTYPCDTLQRQELRRVLRETIQSLPATRKVVSEQS